jgi:hypothetical protein
VRWKHRPLLGFFALCIGIATFQVLFAPGSLFRIRLRESLNTGAPLAATGSMLADKGFTCADLDPPGTGPATRSVLCYRYNDPVTAPNDDGTQVALAAENGRIVGFAIRACGPRDKFLCDKLGARPGWR